MEVLYRIYLAGIFGVGGLIWVAGLLADNAISPSAVARISSDGPALASIAFALLVLGGLRSGARGGPLSVQDADVHHILLAPIERSAVLSAPARRQLWTAALAGAGIGALVAEFSLRRLPGDNLAWIGCLAAFGALAGVALPGSALLASGRRLSIAKGEPARDRAGRVVGCRPGARLDELTADDAQHAGRPSIPRRGRPGNRRCRNSRRPRPLLRRLPLARRPLPGDGP